MCRRAHEAEGEVVLLQKALADADPRPDSTIVFKLGHRCEVLRAQHDKLVEAARAWLKFDNEVEPPGDDHTYEQILAYEKQKLAVTEAVAAALPK
jgi:hypothetical protein